MEASERFRLVHDAIEHGKSTLLGKTQPDPMDDNTWNEYHEFEGKFFEVVYESDGWLLPELTREMLLKEILKPPYKSYLKKTHYDFLRLKEYQQSIA